MKTTTSLIFNIVAGKASSGDAAFTADGLESIRSWLRSYVDDGRLPGAAVLIARNGRIALFQGYGHKSVESRAPIERDTIYRIYPMTKPVTAAAAMALIEDGALSLDAPVARYIPAFDRLTVNRCGAGDRLDARPAERAMTILHLLTHTSGLTYGEGNPGAVARLYERQHTDFGPNDGPLADVVDRLAGIPLLFEPGAAWNYGVSSDVLGRVIEIAAGRPLDVFIEERILTPLRMTDTGFRVPDAKLNRLASLYQATLDDRFTLLESAEHTASSQPVTLAGGAGLVSTVDDYFRFAEMLRRGGTLEGVKILTESSVRLMTTNHLPHDLAVMGQATFNETTTDGVGYGLGMSVVTDPARTAWRSGRGEFAWGRLCQHRILGRPTARHHRDRHDPTHPLRPIPDERRDPRTLRRASDRHPAPTTLHSMVTGIATPIADPTGDCCRITSTGVCSSGRHWATETGMAS